MSQQYVPSIKVCGTCDYWGGKRECKQYGDYAELDSATDSGQCYCAESGWRGHSGGVQACSCCPHWVLWCALKK